MSKIIKGQVNVDRSVYTDFSKDMGFFSIHADVWSVVSECGVLGSDVEEYSHDVTEVSTRFRINGETVRNAGFEELYIKLYGDGKFAAMVLEFEQEVEKAYYETTEYTPIKIK